MHEINFLSLCVLINLSAYTDKYIWVSVLQIVQESVIRKVTITVGSLFILFAFIELLTVSLSIQIVAL